MTDELNNAYPLNDLSFREGFSSWKKIQEKEIDYLKFREFADKHLKEIKDSIRKTQDHYVSLTNWIINNLATIEYSILKDSLTILPTQFPYTSRYYFNAINEVAIRRPEYFFRLAEDADQNRDLIFRSVVDDKQVMQTLNAVEGHDEIKQWFFSQHKHYLKKIGMKEVVRK
jgi:hypothetical protein